MRQNRLNIPAEKWSKFLYSGLILLTIGISLQSYLAGYNETLGGLYSQFNNYLIFKLPHSICFKVWIFTSFTLLIITTILSTVRHLPSSWHLFPSCPIGWVLLSGTRLTS